jgi:hypothetical protein
MIRERSSPGVRNSIMNSCTSTNLLCSGSSQAFLPNFDEIYKSVERTGGIGCSKSSVNLAKVRDCSNTSLLESARRSNADKIRSLSKHSYRNAILGEHSFKIQREVIESEDLHKL